MQSQNRNTRVGTDSTAASAGAAECPNCGGAAVSVEGCACR